MVASVESGWPKKITVERKIVNLLSKSLYSDFPRAIREAVSNSYDADATIVKITIDRENGEIVIEDNGNGMSAEQFGKYLRIAGQKSEAGFSEKFRRKRIGRFGVGFLASFPFCKTLEIKSKREGSDLGFTANIPTQRFVEGSGAEEDVSSIPVDGYDEAYPEKQYEHYTQIKMIGLTEVVDAYFKSRAEQRRITIESWNGMERLKWQLSETLPLDFKYSNSELANCLSNESVGMEVWLNGEKLYRNDFEGQVIQGSGKTYVQLGSLSFGYAITTNWKIMQPVEARGLKVRLNNVGIGSRTYFDIEKEVRTFSRLNWLVGEVHVIEGLDESLTLTRDSFIWSPQYQDLKDFFHKVLLRTHSIVENVDSVERELKENFTRKNVLPLVSKREIIDKSIKRLSNAGFTILHGKRQERVLNTPIIIDKRRTTAIVIDDYPLKVYQNDKSKEEPEIRYKPFDREENLSEPVRVAEDGVIELNTLYPLFKGKTKGDILKQVHLLLFLAKRECNTVEEMYNYMLRRIKEQFEKGDT